jgi:hypothetical protein
VFWGNQIAPVGKKLFLLVMSAVNIKGDDRFDSKHDFETSRTRITSWY